MRNKLSLKERKFLKCYVKTGNLAKSAKAAGSKGKDVHSLSVVGFRMLQAVKPEIDELMHLKGLTDSRLLEKLEEGENATVVRPFAHEGKVISEPVYVDYATRAKYLELEAKIKGLLKERREVSGEGGGPVKIEVVYEEDGNGAKEI